MLKKLTAKVQQLNPNLEESVNGFSKCLVIEPETQDLLLKKGSLYIVFDISGNTRFDVALINNVVHDMLHDSYYQSESISPIQSLEKAITEVRDRVTQLANESIIIERQEIEFNIVVGALWGNVLYVVQYGTSKSYLMRMGDIKPISTTSEGNFSAASGVVKDEDVVIFSSKEFADDYPPDRLLTVSIPESQLHEKQACLLMKFIIDTNFTQNEIVDFGAESIKVKKEVPSVINSATGFLSKLKVKKEPKKEKEPEKIKELVPQPISEIGVRLKKPGKFHFKLQYIVPVLIVMLGLSIFFTVKNKKPTPAPTTPKVEQPKPTEQPSNQQPTPPTQEQPDNTAFYDLKLTDQNIQPSAVVVFTDHVVIGDYTTGKIYVSERQTPKFTEGPKAYPGLKNMVNIKGQLGFTDSEGYKVLEVPGLTLKESYATTGLGVTSAYAEFVYSVSGDKVTRYSKENSRLVGSLWGENPELTDVKSFGISYSLFMLKNDGSVIKYTSGEKNNFSLSGDNPTLNSPTQIIADVDFNDVYLADSGNKRVISFDKNGKILKEYKADDVSKWSEIKSIGISPDEKTLYVLTGTRIYEVSL